MKMRLNSMNLKAEEVIRISQHFVLQAIDTVIAMKFRQEVRGYIVDHDDIEVHLQVIVKYDQSNLDVDGRMIKVIMKL